MSSASIKEFEHLRISLQDLESATNNFAETKCIGGGGFGKVYKGEIFLSGVQTMVAIKRLDRSFGQGTTEFWKEIMLLSQYKHENLVSLLGFCDEGGENLLVYEYISNRSLDFYLYSFDLSWQQRLNICLGAAIGLQYLHEPIEGSQQRVLHRDIKSANILLDHNWRAKIADFGLSKLGPANQQFTFLFSNAVGTTGYCDPLYANTGLLTKESDVYSFGVVLFEVLCGRPCIIQKYVDIRRSLPALSRKCYEENKMDTIIPIGLHYNVSPESLERFSTIAYRCLQLNREERPTMGEVVEELRFALNDQIIHEKKIAEAKLKQIQLVAATMQKVELKEILAATNNFKLCIGKTRDGVWIYEGELSIVGISRRVFIKRFPTEHSRLTLIDNNYLKEVEFLSKLHHPNIFLALGYCYEEREKIIVFECPVGESLHQRIRDCGLAYTWLQTLEICAAAGRGLSYLLSAYKSVKGFNSACIFVDDKWRVKIANSEIYSTSGLDRDADAAYNSPEYVIAGLEAPENTVYSFGMVLFEVLRRWVRSGEVDTLPAKLLKESYERKKLHEIIDFKSLEISSNSVDKYSAIAYRCLLDDPQQRPSSMDDVVKELEELLSIEIQEATIELKQRATMQKVELKEIEVATNNFTSYIGETPDGVRMYGGELSIFGKPTRVVIKRLPELSVQLGDYYLETVDYFSKVHHPNIFSALGYCYEKWEKIAVCEYQEGVSLDQYIRRSSDTSLTWLQRLQICADTGRGLSYLLRNYTIRVKGFKSANIFVDDKWEWVAKADISTQILTDLVRGVDGIINGEETTVASSVYSFGMVLFEVLCGRLCNEEVDGVMLSAQLIKDLYENKKLDEIVDPVLLKVEKISSYSLGKYSAIAYQCLSDDPWKRPSMANVVLVLEELLCIDERILKNIIQEDDESQEIQTMQKFEFKEIQAATNNFTSCICETPDGESIYQGEFSIFEIPTRVLIRRFPDPSGRAPSYVGRVAKFLISKLHHPNCISALGYYIDEDEKDIYIVCEYRPEGVSFDQYISRRRTTSLTWLRRLEICTAAARGLAYLHSKHMAEIGFKSTSIVLDDKVVARIGDSDMAAECSTDLGDAYNAPEYIIDGDESGGYNNVYAFGVVLFEVLCGRLCTEEVDGVMLSAQLIKDLYENKKIDEIVDPVLLREEKMISSSYAVEKYLAIAYQCLSDDYSERPFMADVVIELEEILGIEKLKLGKQFHKEFNDLSIRDSERASALELEKSTTTGSSSGIMG